MEYNSSMPIVKLTNAILQQAVIDHASEITIVPEKHAATIHFCLPEGWKQVMSIPNNIVDACIGRFRNLACMCESKSKTGCFEVSINDRIRRYWVEESHSAIGPMLLIKALPSEHPEPSTK
jgi:type II secretory ATPase GspE/PulE/Tfp pilus assembly ATPase PilB-like protein